MTMQHYQKLRLALIGAVAVGSSVGAVQVAANVAHVDSDGLASAALVDGNTNAAIETLRAELREYPQDPALLINLGIALAQTGNDAEARAQFRAALTGDDVIELDTASGQTTDSRRLARQAIAMLERGEFRAAARQADRLTLRE